MCWSDRERGSESRHGTLRDQRPMWPLLTCFSGLALAFDLNLGTGYTSCADLEWSENLPPGRDVNWVRADIITLNWMISTHKDSL